MNWSKQQHKVTAIILAGLLALCQAGPVSENLNVLAAETGNGQILEAAAEEVPEEEVPEKESEAEEKEEKEETEEAAGSKEPAPAEEKEIETETEKASEQAKEEQEKGEAREYGATITNSGSCGANVTWALDSDGVLTLSGSGSTYDYTNSAAMPWFKLNIRKIVVGYGITRLGQMNFIFNSATEVSLPSSLREIGDSCFQGSKLTSISLPSSLTVLGDDAFRECKSLTTIHIPAGVTSLDTMTFMGCTAMESFTVASGNTAYTAVGGVIYTKDMKTIFRYPPAKADTSFRIQNTVNRIEDNAFRDALYLEKLEIPESVTAIGSCAFDTAKKLNNLVIPSKVTDLDAYLFRNCSSLNTLSFSGSITKIGDGTFQGTALKSFVVPSTCTKIGYEAFKSYSLKKLYVYNANCQLSNKPIGSTPVIYGYAGSTIASYAANNSLTFVSFSNFSEAISSYNGTLSQTSYTYTGEENRPSVTSVTNGTDTLIKDVDYTVSYGRNVNAGTSAYVRLSAIAPHTGYKYLYFTIGKAAPRVHFIMDEMDAIIGTEGLTNYLEESQDNDGVRSYTSSDPAVVSVDEQTGQMNCLSEGDAVITLTVTDATNYQDAELSYTVHVSAPSIDRCTVELDQESFPYTGEPIVPLVSVSIGSVVLEEGKDYSLSFRSNGFPGTAYVIVTGKGSFTGSVTKTFTITKGKLTKFSAQAQENDICIGDTTQILPQYAEGPVSYQAVDSSIAVVNSSGVVTGKGIGLAEITVTAAETDYYESASCTVYISVARKPLSQCTITLSPSEFAFDGTAKEPEVTIRNGNTQLSPGTDYSVSYQDNIDIGTAVCVINGLGNYQGTVYQNFTITESAQTDLSECTVTLEQAVYIFTGENIIPGVTVKDGEKFLTEGTDYSLTCSNNRNAGTASAVMEGMGDYTGSLTKTFTIAKADQAIEASISSSSIKAGDTAAVTVTGNKGDLVFDSSDAAVASVDSTGLVTGLSAGETVITVTAKMTMNYNKAVVQIPVTVTAAPEETGRSIEEISYSFSNSASSFSYPSGYKIPLSSYQIIYGDNTRAEAVYMAHSRSAWGGNCSGLAATSALMTTAGGGVWPHSFKTGASAPKDLAVSDTSSALSMNLTTFVEAMHIAQYTEAFSNERKAHVVYTSAIQAGNKNLDSLYNAVKSKAESDIPTVLALVQAGGHAVLAYKTEEVSSTESRIYIYDSNFPLQDRYITFYKNGGHYTQWSYDMGSYGEWGTDSSASSISYIAYATLKSIWDSRGHVGRDEASLAFVNSQNFAVYDVKGNLEAVFSGGSLSDYTGKISRISDELSLTGGGTQEVVLSIPTKTHTIVNLDRTLSSFAVTVVDTDLGISVDTTVQEVTLSVDDEYSVSSLSMDAGTGDTYSVTLSSSFASGYDKVEVSGTGQGETLSISQSGTNLNFSNCDISLLMVDGQQVGVYEITASATEGGSISPSGTTSLRQGESLACTITPDTGYAIQDVFVDNKSVGAVSSYTFENVRGGHTILATFKKAQTTLETPKVSSVTNVKDGIKIAWGRVEGAENYRIYYKVNGGGWKRLTETTGTSYTWTGAESGNTYGFTLRCMNAAGTSFTSGYDNTGKSVAYIAAPSVTKLESLAGGVRITWTKSTGAALYRIYYKEGTGGWKKLVDTTDTAYTWTGAQSGKTYGFTVRCMNAAGTSFTSGYDDTGKTITYVKPSQIPEVTALSAVTGGLKIDWSSFAGAGVYAVYYKTGTGAGGWKKLVSVSGTSYTWTGAVDGTTYSFTVRAMNDAGTSFVSGYNNTGMSIAYKALASIPKVTSVTNVQSGVKIAWSAFTGAGSYRIFYKESGGSWKKLCDASGTSYTWTGAVSGSFYAFTVRALNAAGTSYVSGYDNTGKTITYVAAPVITTLKKVSDGIQIAWGTCAGAGSYRIFYRENGGGWKKLADVSGTSYTWTGAAAGNTYGFTVRCMDAGSASFVSGYDNTGKSLAF